MHPVTNADELSIDVFHTGGDGVFDGFLDLALDETGSEGFKGFVEGIVLGVADGELERVELHVDILHLEDGAVGSSIRQHRLREKLKQEVAANGGEGGDFGDCTRLLVTKRS